MYLEIFLLILLVIIVRYWNINNAKEGMCNMQYPVCDYACRQAKYEVCLVKGKGKC